VGHGHGHGHGHAVDGDTDAALESARVGRTARRVLAGVLALIGVATVVGSVVLWPDRSVLDALREDADTTGPGVTYPRAEVVGTVPCPETDADRSAACPVLVVRLDEGGDASLPVPPQVVDAGVEAGDRVWLMRTPAGNGEATYSFWAVERHTPLIWLVALFVIVVLTVARMRGARALLGLAVSAAVILGFMLPALLSGSSGVAVALVGASAIMFPVLFLTHGVNLRTSAALAGTLVGVGVTAALASLAVGGTDLTGVHEEGGRILMSQNSGLDFQGLLVCAVIIAGLGILNDVTITQSSSAWEVRSAAPAMSRLDVYRSGMRVGRDHIASTIYTMTFAYTGAALLTLMLLLAHPRPFDQLVSSEELATEIVHTLVSGVGLVLAVPATTAIAALVLAPGSTPSRRTGRRAAR
jgi:uncharacterized membrane protein